MAQRIDDASQSRSQSQTSLRYNAETTRLASEINEIAESLSVYVARMKANLDSFVSVLEGMQITVKKEPSLAERILGWVKSLIKAIARVLAIVCPPISALLPHPVQKFAPAVTALGEAAREFCTADPGAFLEHINPSPARTRSDRLFDTEPQRGKESETLDSVIILLKRIVPNEVQNAQNNLKRFDEALDIMGLERQMRAVRLEQVALHGLDPAAVAKKWRDVAKQYQSALRASNNEDLVS